MSYEEIDALMTAPGQPFELEQIEVEGRQLRSWKNTPPSLAALLEHSRSFGDREFLVYGDERLSYTEHYRRVAALAHRLVDDFGIAAGDRVAIAMRNYPEWCIAFWAAASVGAVVVPLNAWWTSEELAYGLTDSGTRLIFADRERLLRLQAIQSELPLQQVVAARCQNLPEDVVDFQSLLEGAPPEQVLPAVEVQPDDDATLFYTSGTTGFPKGTLGSQRSFCSVALTMAYNGMRGVLRMGASLEDLQALQQMPQTTLLTVPLFHVTGCHGIMLSTFATGGKLVMSYKWDPAEALDLIEREKVTIFGGVPTMIRQLLDAPDIERRDLSSVLNLGYGGAPAPPELLRKIKTTLPSAGASNGWGITETSAPITAISGQDYTDKPDSVGRPFPICDVKAVDEQGVELGAGELGELWVRGPNVVKGYWNKPEATAESFTDGWFHTGDVGFVDDDGDVYIVDRIKDMIIRGGENVYCAEVEAVLVEHPLVNAACVFGLPHEVLGEEVAAVIEVGADDAVSEEELREHAGVRLAKFKVPGRIWIHTEPLPVGATGKVQKKELKQFYQDQLASAGKGP
jgi:long-chain acyl-CoA synthetase